MYVLSIVLLVGAELNDVLARRAGVVQENPSVSTHARSVREYVRDLRNRRAAGDEHDGTSADGTESSL